MILQQSQRLRNSRKEKWYLHCLLPVRLLQLRIIDINGNPKLDGNASAAGAGFQIYLPAYKVIKLSFQHRRH